MGAPWDDSKLIRSLFWIVFFSYYKLQWTFLNQIMTCNEKLILYHNQWWPATGWTEKKPQSTSQSQTCTKKRSWSVFGGLLPIWSTTAFWIPMKQLHLKSMLSISMRHTENCNACSQHWSTERAQFFSIIVPNCTSHNQCFKSWEWIGLRSFVSSTIFTWPLISWLPLLQASWQLFAGKTLPQPAGYCKRFPRVGESRSTRINKHFSLAKMCCL